MSEEQIIKWIINIPNHIQNYNDKDGSCQLDVEYFKLIHDSLNMDPPEVWDELYIVYEKYSELFNIYGITFEDGVLLYNRYVING